MSIWNTILNGVSKAASRVAPSVQSLFNELDEYLRREPVTLHTVDTLSVQDLSAWFKEQQSKHGAASPIKMVVTEPSADMIKLIERNDVQGTSRYMMLMATDESGQTLVNASVFKYQNIDTNLEMMLLDNDGMLVITN